MPLFTMYILNSLVTACYYLCEDIPLIIDISLMLISSNVIYSLTDIFILESRIFMILVRSIMLHVLCLFLSLWF